MANMTDEEAHYWDDYYTKNPPKPGPNGTGYFTQCKKTAHAQCQKPNKGKNLHLPPNLKSGIL